MEHNHSPGGGGLDESFYISLQDPAMEMELSSMFQVGIEQWRLSFSVYLSLTFL